MKFINLTKALDGQNGGRIFINVDHISMIEVFEGYCDIYLTGRIEAVAVNESFEQVQEIIATAKKWKVQD